MSELIKTVKLNKTYGKGDSAVVAAYKSKSIVEENGGRIYKFNR